MFDWIKKINRSIKLTHFHAKYQVENSLIGSYDIVIDQAVEKLWNDRKYNIKNAEFVVGKILELESDLTAIHAHYRSELCGDCCHSEICKLRPNVKYGFECEDKAVDVEVMTFEVEPEKVETEKEETNADHI